MFYKCFPFGKVLRIKAGNNIKNEKITKQSIIKFNNRKYLLCDRFPNYSIVTEKRQWRKNVKIIAKD